MNGSPGRDQNIEARSKRTITIESDMAYTVRIESIQGAQKTTGQLRIRRVGDC